MGDIIIIGVILVLLVLVFFKLKKDKEGGGCMSCPKSCSCPKKKDK